MRIVTTLSFCAGIISAAGAIAPAQEPLAKATPPPESATPPAGTPAAVEKAGAERRTIQQYGMTFVLLRSSRQDNVETEEYFLEHESPENWSQMLTYQRVLMPEPLGADQYTTWLKRRFEESAAGPRLRTVQQGKLASIFGVQYPKTPKAEEEFCLALVTSPDAGRPNELHVVQFAINLARLPVEEMELQVKRWQARFQSQAASLVKP